MKPPIAIICLPEPENACFGHRDAIYTAAECASIVSLGLFLAVFYIFSISLFLGLTLHNCNHIYLDILALLMLVHIALPELRNKPGRNLFGLAFSLKMAFIILVTIRMGLVPMGTTECFAAGRFLTGLNENHRTAKES